MGMAVIVACRPRLEAPRYDAIWPATVREECLARKHFATASMHAYYNYVVHYRLLTTGHELLLARQICMIV